MGPLESLGPITLLVISLCLIIWSILWIILPFIVMGMHSRLKAIDSRLARIVELMEEKEQGNKQSSTFSAGER